MSDATTKTAENVANRRRSTDWKARQPWTDQEHEAATDAADKLGLKLYGLTQVVKLAAFAAECRKALVGIEEALEHRPKVKEDLRNHVHMTAWMEMPDPTGEALAAAAIEMESANHELSDLVYKLSYRLKESEQCEAAQTEKRAA